MVDLSLDGIGDAMEKGLNMAEPFLFGLGFVWGASSGRTYSSQNQLQARITQTLSNLGIGGITVAQGFTSTSSFKFNPTGFLNKGLAAAVAAWVYKEAKLPYSREIYKAVFPFGTGYSLGGFFDPPGPGMVGSYSHQSPIARSTAGLTAPVVS